MSELKNGGVNPNAVTDTAASVNNTYPPREFYRNSFYIPTQFLNTEKFAYITPFLEFESSFGERFRYTRNTDLRCPTFQSPNMSQITKHAHYIAVPKSVIYPRLWEYMTVIPKHGDDIVFENARCMISPIRLINFLQPFFESSTTTFSSTELVRFFKLASLLYYSSFSDSICTLLGCSIFNFSLSEFDGFFSYCFSGYFQLSGTYTGVMVVSDFGERFFQLFSRTDSDEIVLNNSGIRSFFDYFLLHLSDDVLTVEFSNGISTLSSVDVTPNNVVLSEYFFPVTTYLQGGDYFPNNGYINIEPLIAYQMSCSQFFTRDTVDDLFTSKRWYDNMNGLVYDVISGSGNLNSFFFDYNGISIQYEPYSSSVINSMITVDSEPGSSEFENVLNFFLNIFCPAFSLRYGDMFNSARMRPLAVGDYSAPVVSNMVSAVDMTQATLMQRLGNAVNSVLSTVVSQIKMLYGVVPDNIPLQPLYIAHSQDVIGGQLVTNNTSDEQGKLVTNLSLHSKHNEFDVNVNQDTIFLGLTSYDILTPYVAPLSPFALKCDRFDYFNPMLQNIGDQPVRSELLLANIMKASSDYQPYFGYLQNNFEYKQDISKAFGGFVDGSLPGWAMIRDISNMFSSYEGYVESRINSVFVRNVNEEFDQFFTSLTGLGSSYFHFICSYVHELTPSRPMLFWSGVLFQSDVK